MPSRVLASLLAGLGQGANQLYGHRQRQADIGREEAAAADARGFRERSFSAESKHRAAIEALQHGQLRIQEEAQARLRDQNATETEAAALDRALRRAEMLGYIPDNLKSWAAAEALGAPDIMPIEEDFQPAQTMSLQGRKNVRIPGQGTVVYNPDHMSGMNSYMGNFNRESNQPIAARVNALETVLQRVEDQYLSELGKISGTLGLEPPQVIELQRRKDAARKQAAPGLGIGFDAQGKMYDALETHTPRPTSSGSEWDNPFGDSPAQGAGSTTFRLEDFR